MICIHTVVNMAKIASSEESDRFLRIRIGQSIRTLRQIKHWNQAELARRIGVRPGPLNTIEKGRHVPSGRLLMKLADALEVSVDDILGRSRNVMLKEAGAKYLVGVSHGSRPYAQPMVLRDDATLDDATAKRLDDIVHEFLALEDICGAQKSAMIPLRHPFVPDDRGIELLAQQVRSFLGIGQGVIFDYLELFENAGLRVVFCPLPERNDSVAFYDAENGNAFFFINDKKNAEKQIFELAKRLGAIYLHTGGARSPGAINESALDSLQIARKFAAFFLMPEAAMRTTVAQTGIMPDRWTYELVLSLKHRFGVSAEAFVIRLEELSLITLGLARRFKKRIRNEYKRTGFIEPGGSRRILSPNGRLGDLRLVAGRSPK